MSADAAPAGPKGGFSPAVMAALAIVGLIAFVAFFAGNAFDTGPRAEIDTSPHAASKGAVGFAGAVDLLKRTGHPAVVTRGPILTGRPGQSVLVVTLANGMTGSIFENSVVKRHSGPVLVILPKWATGDHPERLGWVRKRGLLRVPTNVWLKPPVAEKENASPSVERPKQKRKTTEEALRDAIEGARREEAADPSRVTLTHASGEGIQALYLLDGVEGRPIAIATTGVVDRMQTFRHAPGWTPIIVDQQGRAVLAVAADEDEDIYVLSEPDLLSTHGIADIGNARAGLAVLDETYGPGQAFIFDVSMHGLSRSRSFLRQAFEPPFLAATLCALATVLLMGWHAFVRFGRAHHEGRAFSMGKRALADNQADLIKMTGRESRMGGPYATVVRDVTARAVGAPRDLSPDALDALMDRLGEGGRTSWTLSTLREDLSKPKDAADLQKAAARLHHWRLEMTRERK